MILRMLEERIIESPRIFLLQQIHQSLSSMQHAEKGLSSVLPVTEGALISADKTTKSQLDVYNIRESPGYKDLLQIGGPEFAFLEDKMIVNPS